MARMNKKTEVFTDSRNTSSSGRIEPLVSSPKPSNPQSSSTAMVEPRNMTNRPAAPTHQQIEQRAGEIWRQKGCPVGQDEKNWLEAEAQLKKELGIK